MKPFFITIVRSCERHFSNEAETSENVKAALQKVSPTNINSEQVKNIIPTPNESGDPLHQISKEDYQTKLRSLEREMLRQHFQHKSMPISSDEDSSSDDSDC